MRPGSAAVFLILLMNVSTGQTLTCGPYHYEIHDRCCTMCPAGGWVSADCTDFRSTLCKPCPDGTFMDHPTYHPVCYISKSCDEGSGLKMKTSCTKVSDTVCEPLEGFYCSDSRKDDCVEARKHRHCEPGEYIREHGTSSTDTVCSTCSDGTFLDGTFTFCQKHKQCESEGLLLLRAGTKTEDAQCGDIPSDWTGLIVGGVLGHLAVVLVALTAWFCREKITSFLNRKKKSSAGTPDESGFVSRFGAKQGLESQVKKVCCWTLLALAGSILTYCVWKRVV